MSLLIAAAFIGGFLRGLFAFSSHHEKRVLLGFMLFAAIAEGFIGMLISLGLLYMGWISTINFTGQMTIMFFAGYVGADIINSLYKILYKKRVQFE